MRIRGWLGRADQTTKIRGMFVRPEQVAALVARHPEVRRARVIAGRDGEQDTMTVQVEAERADAAAIAASVQAVMKLRGRGRGAGAGEPAQRRQGDRRPAELRLRLAGRAALPRWEGRPARICPCFPSPFSTSSPIPEGATARQALMNTLDLARHAEAWGYRRFWLAEHHNMPGIASAATAVLIGQVAAATKTIRVGAGGIMLPNHAPLMVAEAFGTLATLFPGRIDLGLGRAPGTDMATARALRRNLEAAAESFPQDVVELMGYLGEDDPEARVRAIPGVGTRVPVWILGLEPLRGAARGLAGAALFLRLAFRAGGSRGGAGGLSRDFPAIGIWRRRG